MVQLQRFVFIPTQIGLGFTCQKSNMLTCCHYTLLPIKSNDFVHKGLERFFLTGSKAGIQAAHARKLQLILGRLNASAAPRDMNLPGLYLHELKGDRQGTWSVRVSGNWRVTFQFDGTDAVAVDYEDYH